MAHDNEDRYIISFPSSRCVITIGFDIELDEDFYDDDYPHLWEEYRISLYRDLLLLLEEFMGGYLEEVLIMLKDRKTPRRMITEDDFSVSVESSLDFFGEDFVDEEDDLDE